MRSIRPGSARTAASNSAMICDAAGKAPFSALAGASFRWGATSAGELGGRGRRRCGPLRRPANAQTPGHDRLLNLGRAPGVRRQPLAHAGNPVLVRRAAVVLELSVRSHDLLRT